MTYDIEGFLDKNRDLLFKDLSQAMYACERPLLKELFPEGLYKVAILACGNDTTVVYILHMQLTDKMWCSNS